MRHHRTLPESVRHAVESGQDVLKVLILSVVARRRFFIHPRCTRTLATFQNYRGAFGLFIERPPL